MVEGGGFEPPKLKTADLQSAPVGRLGIPPTSKARHFRRIRQESQYKITVISCPFRTDSLISEQAANYRQYSVKNNDFFGLNSWPADPLAQSTRKIPRTPGRYALYCDPFEPVVTMPKLLFLLAWLLCCVTLVNANEPATQNHSIKTSVALSPHITELIYSAGAQDGLLGVSAYSNYPPAVSDITVIGDAFHINTEMLAQLKPDVVFYWAGGTPQQTVEKIKSMQLHAQAVVIEDLSDIPQAIKDIATTLGSEPEAEVQEFTSRLQALRDQALPNQTALIQISDQPIYTVNGSHWMSEAIAVCGLENVFADLEPASAAVTLESVVLHKPEVIVRLEPLSPDSRLAQWTEIPAIKNQQVAVLEADHFTRPTLRLLLAIESLCQQVSGHKSKH